MTPLPKTFYPSKKKSIGLIAISIIFVVMGAFLYRAGETPGLFVTIFFAACAVVISLNLLPHAAYLRVTQSGIDICTLFKVSHVAWNVIDHFEVAGIQGVPMVAVIYRQQYREQEVARNIAKTISGVEGVLPDSYGKTPDKLACILNAIKEEVSPKATIGE